MGKTDCLRKCLHCCVVSSSQGSDGETKDEDFYFWGFFGLLFWFFFNRAPREVKIQDWKKWCWKLL